jgi:hypothetical protein
MRDPRWHKRAADALNMLSGYVEMDRRSAHGPIIETYRIKSVDFGVHTVRARQDLLFFGARGHSLRNVTWSWDQLPDALLPFEFAPIVKQLEDELGTARLERAALWQMRTRRVVAIDVRGARRAAQEVALILDRAEAALVTE